MATNVRTYWQIQFAEIKLKKLFPDNIVPNGNMCEACIDE